VTILVADDDEDDRELIGQALEAAGLAGELKFVHDGQEAIDYLRREGAYARESSDTPRPWLILLDLNMPRKDGREVLAEIRADETLRGIPVVILTTSKDKVDVRSSYALGANSFITKPISQTEMNAFTRILSTYWFEVVSLPEDDDSDLLSP
jgi:two-component system, response regulator